MMCFYCNLRYLLLSFIWLLFSMKSVIFFFNFLFPWNYKYNIMLLIYCPWSSSRSYLVYDSWQRCLHKLPKTLVPKQERQNFSHQEKKRKTEFCEPLSLFCFLFCFCFCFFFCFFFNIILILILIFFNFFNFLFLYKRVLLEILSVELLDHTFRL